MPLNLAIVHYHLRPGGATRVIENAIKALEKVAGSQIKITVLTGSEHRSDDIPNVQEVEGLGYRDRNDLGPSANELADRLYDRATDGLGAKPDLWHFHNHNLGKNPILTEAVAILAQRGEKLLLQLHDFCEDGRPGMFEIMKDRFRYPHEKGVAYAVLNERDFGILQKSGADPKRLFLLGNPVHLPNLDQKEPHDDETRVIFYPTRGIRRKNLGECLLLASLFPRDTPSLLLTSRGPDNPLWKNQHDQWEILARDLKLPVKLAVVGQQSPKDLGVGSSKDSSFQVWLKRADLLITTSIAEGFGLAFLEPYLLGKPLAGRDLPEITADFTTKGVQLNQLYRRIGVPLAWLNETRLREDFLKRLQTWFAQYGRKTSANSEERLWDSLVRDGTIDFGRLQERDQETILRHLSQNPTDRSQVEVQLNNGQQSASNWIAKTLTTPSKTEIEKNGKVIAKNYSLLAYGTRLWSALQQAAEPSVNPISAIDPEKLINQFLDPARFQSLASA